MATAEPGFHLIFGTGAAASFTGQNLLKGGYQVHFASRSGRRHKLIPAECPVHAVEAMDGDEVRRAAAGAAVIYNCLNVPYQRWNKALPRFQSNLLAAAESSGARLVVLENLYGYGPVARPMTEEFPLKSQSKKGKLRAEMSQQLMRAYEQGRANIVIARASDFYGPGVTNSFLGERAFGPLVAGKAAQVIGDPEQPHSYAYIEDVGKGLMLLGTQEQADGQVWHLPHAPAVSTRDMLLHGFELAAQEPQIRSMGRLMLILGGLFIPEARQSLELLYEFEQPFLVNDKKFRDSFNQLPTAIPSGLQKTIRWYQTEFIGSD